MINFNTKGFGGAPPQDPETLRGYDPYFDYGKPDFSPPNPDAGGGSGFYPMPPIDLYFQPIAVNTRQQNINNMYSTTDANGIIQNPYSSYDKTPFSDYVSQNAVTSEELQIARASVFGFYDYGPAVMRPAVMPPRPAVMPPIDIKPPFDRYSPPNPDGGGGGDWSIRSGGGGYDGSGILPDYLRPDDYRRTYDPLPSNDNNKLFFDCKQIDGVFVYTKESVSLYGTLQLQKKMQFYTDKGFLAKLKPAELGANISTPLGGKFVPFAKKMPNGRYKFIYSGENGTQTLIVSPKGVLVNIKSGGC
jgi:hypothetical protein